MHKYLNLSLGLLLSVLAASAPAAEAKLQPATAKARVAQPGQKESCPEVGRAILGFATKSHHDHWHIKKALEASPLPCRTLKQ